MRFHDDLALLPESGVSVEKRVEDFLRQSPSQTLIHLDQRLMNMPLPPSVTEGMKTAVEETASPYGKSLESPWAGYPSLKKAIADHLASFGAEVNEEEVMICAGLESAYASLSALFDAQNEVILPDPGRRSLLFLHRCAGRNVSFLRATPENGFAPPIPSSGADLIHLASPDPVTGVPMTRERAKEWVDFANQNGSILFFDSSLSEYLDPAQYFRSIYEIEGARDCAIELFSFEEGYGVRELKIAYCVIPTNLVRQDVRVAHLFALHQPYTATPPSYVMQKAARLLFSPESAEETRTILHRIQKVAKTLSAGLSEAGIPHVGGEAGPYLWAQCPFGWNAWQTFDAFLEHAHCVVTPGSLFGYGGERYFRLTAFGLPDEAVAAMGRLSEAMTAFRAQNAPEAPAGKSTAELFGENE